MYKCINDFEYNADVEISAAERNLIDACRQGKECKIGDGKVPPENCTDKNITIRAELLRILIIGGTSRCDLHEKGVYLNGAFIEGELDLSFVKAKGLTALDNCRFSEKPQMARTEFSQLSLDGSHLPGLFAEGIKVLGDVYFRRIVSTSTLDISGAEIGGQISLLGAELKGEVDSNGNLNAALMAQGIRVASSMFLVEMKALGCVDVMVADIGGQLEFNRAKLDGGTDSNGMRHCALNAQGAKINRGFFFQEIESVSGDIDLVTAHISELVDDADSWNRCVGNLFLNGLSYDHLSGNTSPKTFLGRRDWLQKGAWSYGQFFPQPYTQLAKVLRAAGNLGEARKVLSERDRLLYSESEKALESAYNLAYENDDKNMGTIGLRLLLLRGWNLLIRTVIGYGYAPQRACYIAASLIFIGAAWFFIAFGMGLMVPNSAVILVSSDWTDALSKDPLPTHSWLDLYSSAMHYETFYSLPYALDVFVPFVSLGQESAWAATTVTTAGFLTRWFIFLYQIVGWVVTSLGIAAVTGFVQRSDVG